MKRLLLAIFFGLSPALADEPKSVSITASASEVQQLGQLLDIATKACGLQCAQASVHWAEKLQQAVNDANKSSPPVPPDEQH